MDEPRAVGHLEGARDVDEPAELARERDLGARRERAERGADHVLHGEIEAVARLADVVDADDVGVAQRRDGPGLAEEAGRELAGEALGVVRPRAAPAPR